MTNMAVIEQLTKCWKALRFLYRTRIRVPSAIHLAMRGISRRHTPILVGPWLSEVGFEVLYWIPFVRRLFREYRIAPERVIVVSRGGTLPWYADFARSYVEIFEHVTPTEFVRANQQRERQTGGKKQFGVKELDRRILRLVCDRLDLGRYELVHPSWMYELFSAFWCGWMDVYRLMTWCEHRRIHPVPPRPEGIPFRGDYAAIKFYFSACFPDTEANRHFVQRVVAQVARNMPVVLLNTGMLLDDHEDSGQLVPDNVFDASCLMEPATNLTIQTAIVAHASRLICTYGGFSYLGPLLGKPTVSFWSEPNFVSAHLQFAHEALSHWPGSRLTVMPTDMVDQFWGFGSSVRAVAA